MRDRGCSAEDAYAELVHRSNTGNRKLRDIAQEIVDDVQRNPPGERAERERGPGG